VADSGETRDATVGMCGQETTMDFYTFNPLRDLLRTRERSMKAERILGVARRDLRNVSAQLNHDQRRRTRTRALVV